MKVYIAHPYGKRRGLSDIEIQANVHQSVKLGVEVFRKGHDPFVPNLAHYMSIEAPEITEEQWLDWSIGWLSRCDAILVGGISDGVEKELAVALKLGIKIYWSLKGLECKENQGRD